VTAVDDWDSVVALPEAAIVGVAAALFNEGESTLEQSVVFLDAYTRATRRLEDTASRQVAWASGLWARLVDAKKGMALGLTANAHALRDQASDRAWRAGVST